MSEANTTITHYKKRAAAQRGRSSAPRCCGGSTLLHFLQSPAASFNMWNKAARSFSITMRHIKWLKWFCPAQGSLRKNGWELAGKMWKGKKMKLWKSSAQREAVLVCCLWPQLGSEHPTQPQRQRGGGIERAKARLPGFPFVITLLFASLTVGVIV